MVVALLNHLHMTPPDGFRFLVRETETWLHAELFDELVTAVIDHRLYKDLPGTDRAEVELEVQRQMCAGALPGVCHAERGEDYVPFKDNARGLSLSKIESASATLMAWLGSGMKMISPEEARARAAICRSCPYNRPIPACICTTFWKAIDMMIPGNRKEPGLYVCGLCGCALAAKVLAPLSVVQEGNSPNLRLPEWCWQKQPAT